MSEADGKYPDEVVAYARLIHGINSMYAIMHRDDSIGLGVYGQLAAIDAISRDLIRSRMVKVHGTQMGVDLRDWSAIAAQALSFE